MGITGVTIRVIGVGNLLTKSPRPSEENTMPFISWLTEVRDSFPYIQSPELGTPIIVVFIFWNIPYISQYIPYISPMWDPGFPFHFPLSLAFDSLVLSKPFLLLAGLSQAPALWLKHPDPTCTVRNTENISD